jgi:hypothetical protein
MSVLYGPDGKVVSGGPSLELVHACDAIMFDMLRQRMAFMRANTEILAPNGNDARYEVEQQEIQELERML